MVLNRSRSHQYHTPDRVIVTITMGTTIQRFPADWYVVVRVSSGR